ncbi:hypothetical protein Goari_009466, partial [Gossypium aridum]|nr:hypothetical protein [Gossypium aridum]
MFEWDDSAGLTAFQEAKQRFWEIYHGFPFENKLPNNAFLVSGVIVATLLMLGVRHVQRLYNEKK